MRTGARQRVEGPPPPPPPWPGTSSGPPPAMTPAHTSSASSDPSSYCSVSSDSSTSDLDSAVPASILADTGTGPQPVCRSVPERRTLVSLPMVRTVKVTNVSLSASEQDIKEFFSFSGDIEHVEMQGGDEWSQIAYVTFRDSQGAETALLLSGATIVDLSVIITPAPHYQPPPTASAPLLYPESNNSKPSSGGGSAVQKAEDVVTSMLAKGFVLGQDAVGKARAFDNKHQLTSTASAKVVSFDRKIGLSEKISIGTSAVNDKVKDMDNKFQVSEKTKLAFATAEQKVSSAGSAIMKNRYIFTGASFVTNAFNKVAKAAGDVGSKTKEKVTAEQQQKGS